MSQREQWTARCFLQSLTPTSLWTHTLHLCNKCLDKYFHYPYFTKEEAEAIEVKDPAQVSQYNRDWMQTSWLPALQV